MATQQELDAAKLAYHNLMLGKAPRVIVDSNGERIEYTMANAARLKSYIDELQRSLTSTKVCPPARVYF